MRSMGGGGSIIEPYPRRGMASYISPSFPYFAKGLRAENKENNEGLVELSRVSLTERGDTLILCNNYIKNRYYNNNSTNSTTMNKLFIDNSTNNSTNNSPNNSTELVELFDKIFNSGVFGRVLQ